MLNDFYVYLADQKIKEIQETRERKEKEKKYQSNDSNPDIIQWIEKLLQTPIEDYRKFCIWRILAPYLLNVKKLSAEQTGHIIKDWLDRCHEIQRLDFNAKLKIKEGLKGAEKGYFPISFEDLKVENRKLYEIIRTFFS